MNLRRGRELLAVRAGVDRIVSGVLPARPSVRASTTIGDRNVDVRFSVSDGLVRIRFEHPVAIERVAGCEIGGEALMFLLAIDDLDRSRRTYLARKLSGQRCDDKASLRDRLESLFEPSEQDVSHLSPAARSLDSRMQELEFADGAAELHIAALRKRGLEAIAQELVEADLVVPLEKGHVIGRAALDRRREQLDSLGESFQSRDAAALWGCSHGRARAILAQMLRDGTLERTEEGFAPSREDV
ncbi:MAG: hypothetical protein ACOC2N_00845 [Spirochaetota bacterium]